MPFVVVRIERLRRRLARDLARRVAEVEALDVLEPPLARELRRALGLGERPRLVDLGAAEDAPVARGERLRHRRGRAEDVDDDPDRRGRLLSRSEGDVDAHPARLVRMSTAETRYCYRHPDRRDRPLVLRVRPADLHRLHDRRPGRAPLPRSRHRQRQARRGSRDRRVARRSRRTTHLRGTEALVTKTLIALNVADLPDHRRAGQRAQRAAAAALFDKMVLCGPYVAHGRAAGG